MNFPFSQHLVIIQHQLDWQEYEYTLWSIIENVDKRKSNQDKSNITLLQNHEQNNFSKQLAVDIVHHQQRSQYLA
jgi:hypothetical protein